MRTDATVLLLRTGTTVLLLLLRTAATVLRLLLRTGGVVREDAGDALCGYGTQNEGVSNDGMLRIFQGNATSSNSMEIGDFEY